MTREQALAWLHEWVQSESLRKHALAVEAAMRRYARRFGGDVEAWGLAGLLHDLDYERFPEPPAHTREAARFLRAQGVDEEVVGAILSHARWNWEEYPLDRPIRRALFAVDELCGFLMAVAHVRPERLEGLQPPSVRKKLKQKSFAAGVSREDVEQGAACLGLPLDEHIAEVTAALQQVAGDLGLGIRTPGSAG